MSNKQHASAEKIKRALKDFEEAVREHENMGSQHPNDQFSIDQDYHSKKERILSLIDSLAHHQ